MVLNTNSVTSYSQHSHGQLLKRKKHQSYLVTEEYQSITWHMQQTWHNISSTLLLKSGRKPPGEVISNAVLIKNIKPLQIYVLWKFSRAGLGNLFQNTKFALFDSTFLTTSIMCLMVILGRIKHFRFEVHLGVLLVLTSNCCFCKSLASSLRCIDHIQSFCSHCSFPCPDLWLHW